MTKVQRETARGFAVSESANSTVTNTTVETTLFTQTIVGGRMGTSKELKFSILCDLTTVLTPPTVTIRLKLGGSSLVIISGLSLAASQTSKPFVIEGVIANKNSASAQVIYAKINQYALSIPVLLSGASAMDTADWTVDTTTDQAFAITAQFGGLSATTTLTFRLASIELT